MPSTSTFTTSYNTTATTDQFNVITPPYLNNIQQRATSGQRSVKRKRNDQDEDSQLLNDAFQILKSSVYISSDAYNSYGQYIANELRKYDNRTLAIVKKTFSDILFKADLGLLESQL